MKLTESGTQPVGIWGQRHLRYLKGHKRATYTTLPTNGNPNSYLANIDKRVEEMLSQLIKQMTECERITEQQKENNQLEWVQKMNNIRNKATEIVNTAIIYTA